MGQCICAANPACRGYCDHDKFIVPIASVMASWCWAYNAKVHCWWPCRRTDCEETNSCNGNSWPSPVCIAVGAGVSLGVAEYAGIGRQYLLLPCHNVLSCESVPTWQPCLGLWQLPFLPYTPSFNAAAMFNTCLLIWTQQKLGLWALLSVSFFFSWKLALIC